MKLACDEMLHGLARWLRAAGYDTLSAPPGVDDAELLARCRAEDRVLVTKDRKLAGPAVLVLSGDDPDAHVRVLSAELGIDWLAAPFTRCLVDNAVLLPADESQKKQIPESARGLRGPVRACPACGRIYWPGSHVRRMQARLEAFAQTAQGIRM